MNLIGKKLVKNVGSSTILKLTVPVGNKLTLKRRLKR